MGTAQWRTHRERFNRSLGWNNLFYLVIKKVYYEIFYPLSIFCCFHYIEDGLLKIEKMYRIVCIWRLSSLLSSNGMLIEYYKKRACAKFQLPNFIATCFDEICP